ncbi:MAG: site-specific DNA-methyltransferase [Lachnospiraceae bacterium]|nr:site-specific DNA-methyltransferase [Lachnospiraceae bacterium]
MKNLSAIKREKMISFLEMLKQQHTDEESLIAINQIQSELCAKKYGLIWEKHEEIVDVMMNENIPVFSEDYKKELVFSPKGNFNFLLEGDNLHSLYLLEKTHKGKVDVIYIDPPYNTKNKDFLYDDVYVDGNDGFRHSKWLSFMYERLCVAKNLLSMHGCIFISIDDNEQANLKVMCDEIFGEEKFVALIPWRKRTAKSDVPYGISQDFESILCYANSNFLAAVKGKDRKYYETEDFPGRPWRFHDLTKQTTIEERPNSNFTIVNPKNGKEYPVNPLRSWAITSETFEKYYQEDRIIFPGDYEFLKISKPVLRYWKADDVKKAGDSFGYVAASTFLPNEVVGMTQDGTKEITNIFGCKKFNFPKPVSLIKFLVEISTANIKDALVLDFFAGSGTTGQAVLELNQKDSGNRKFILCTNNENGICEEITYERVKTVITGKRQDGSVYSEGIPANLKYYRTDFVSKTDEYLADSLLGHIREMIQLEQGIKLDNESHIIIMNDNEADQLEQNWSDYTEIKAIYIAQDVLLTASQEALFGTVDVYDIPEYYFNFELREAGELW